MASDGAIERHQAAPAARSAPLLESLPRAAVVAISLLLITLVGVLDYMTGYELSVSVFYLVPVSFGAWYNGRRFGFSVSILCSIIWYFAEINGGRVYSHIGVPVWNALVHLGFFLAGAYAATKLAQSLAWARTQALIDPLTGLSTRRAFDIRLEQGLALARRNSKPISIAFIDVDDFKGINDRFGHQEGDRALRVIADTLARVVRHVDTAARLGGDEFCLMLPNTAEAGAKAVVDKVMSDLRQHQSPSISCSVGVITLHTPTLNVQGVIDAADKLMYAVKRSGKNAARFNTIA